MSQIERACALACLILHDDNLEITADRISAITAAAGIEVEPIYASLFAKALHGRNVGDFLMQIGSSSAAAPAAAAATSAAPKEEKKEDKKAAAKAQESEEELGLSLFD